MNALELNGVCKSFGKTEVIRGIDLAIPSGERHADHRTQRAGKSTLFNLISGRFEVSSGTIRLNGHRSPTASRSRSTGSGLRASFQITNIFHRLSVFENLRCAVLWSLGPPLCVLEEPEQAEGCGGPARRNCCIA